MATPWKIRRTVDLEKCEQKAEHLGILAFTGAKNAHQMILTVFENDQPVSFTSATNVMVYFIRAGEKVTIKCSLTANVLTFRFPAAAYAIQTRVSVLVCAENTDEKVPLYAAVFDPGNGSENVVIDPDDVIPDVSEVLSQAAAAQEAAAAAKSAAEKANAAASHAPYVGEDGYWYAWDAAAGKYVSTGTKAQGPVGPQGPPGQNGTVTGVKIGENTYEPDSTGMVDMSGMTAPNATQLNGKGADEYLTTDKVVNNFTTTEEGFVADARTVKMLNDGLSNCLTKTTLPDAINKSTDWDLIRNGVHFFNTWSGSGGNNYPLNNGIGILFCISNSANGVTFQVCIANEWMAVRNYENNAWKDWKYSMFA